MTKKELIEWLDDFSDDQELDVDVYEDMLIPWSNKDKFAFEVYKKIINAISDGCNVNFQAICEAVHPDDLSWLAFLDEVKVEPVVRDGKLYYKIAKECIEKNNKLYDGLFEDGRGYFVHQVCHFEDDYSGQMLIDLGYNEWMCVEYNC